MLDAVLLGAGGALFLAAFYEVVSVEWPQSYFSGGSLPEFVVSRTVSRFLAFRALPPYAAGLLCDVTATRLHGWGWLAAAIAVAAHLGATSGRAAYVLVRSASVRQPAGRSQLLLHVVPGIVVLLLSLGAVLLTSDPFKGLVPAPTALTEALWTGVFVATIGGLTRSFTSGRAQPGALLEEGRRTVGVTNTTVAIDVAARHRLDAEFFLAVLYAEAIQRPAWFRRAERLAGHVRHGGTYGLAQASAAPVDDRQSIEDLAASLADARLPRTNGRVVRQFVEAGAELHHTDPTYVSLASRLYDEMQRQYMRATDELSADFLPLFTLRTRERRGTTVSLRGGFGPEITKVLLFQGPLTVGAFARGEVAGRVDWTIGVGLEFADTGIEIAAFDANGTSLVSTSIYL